MNAWRYLSEDQLCQQSFEDRPEPTTREENRNVDRLFGKSFTFSFLFGYHSKMIFLCRSTDRGVLVGAYTSSGTSYRRQRYVLRDVETTFLKNLILILPQMS